MKSQQYINRLFGVKICILTMQFYVLSSYIFSSMYRSRWMYAGLQNSIKLCWDAKFPEFRMCRILCWNFTPMMWRSSVLVIRCLVDTVNYLSSA